MEAKLKKELIKKRLRILEQLKEYEVKDRSEIFNYHGGWSAGYLRGRASCIEDILDEVDSNWENLK